MILHRYSSSSILYLLSLPVAFLCVSLAGCSSQDSKPAAEVAPLSSAARLAPEELIARAMASDDAREAAGLYLSAGEAYLKQGRDALAYSSIADLDSTQLAQSERTRYIQLLLQVGTRSEDPAILEKLHQAGAIEALLQQPVTAEQRKARLRQAANAYEILGKPLEMALLLAESLHEFNPSEQPELVETIWSGLRQAPLDELALYRYLGGQRDVHGWLELARNFVVLQSSIEKQYQAMKDFQARWPQHPATRTPPHELVLLQALPNTKPERVILALPFSGPLASVGHAVRHGFLAAMYDDIAKGRSDVAVHFFDTASNPLEQLYATYPADRQTLVIGPLDKNALKELMTFDSLPIKTLALNYATKEDQRTIPQLIQFGLSPEQEAAQVAQQLAQHGLLRTAIIAPESELGQRMHDAFVESYLQAGGVIPDSVFFRSQEELSEAASELLGTTESSKRFSRVRQVTNLALEFEPRRRQDIDAIFLAATPAHAKQLNPLFAFNFAADVPVFATSLVHDTNASEHNDLNGIKFIQMPWLLSQSNHLRTQLSQSLQQESQTYSQFHALGVDAYTLMPRLTLLEMIPDNFVAGQTGELRLENQKVVRSMQWAEFAKGAPIAINDPAR